MSIVSSTKLQLKYGEFNVSYHTFSDGDCVSFWLGDLSKPKPIVRIHSACLFGEAFSSLHCDCNDQLKETLKKIKINGAGVVIYSYSEGRGIGLKKKIEAMEIQRTKKLDTVQAFAKLGFKPDLRNYNCEINALNELRVNKTIKLISNNPNKINSLKEAGYIISRNIKIKINLNKFNKQELLIKKTKMGYYID